MSRRHLLFVVQDLDLQTDLAAAATKTGQLATALDADVEVFCPLVPLIPGALALYAELIPQQQEAARVQAEQRLQPLTDALRDRGIGATLRIGVDTQFAVFEAVAARVKEIGASMVVTASSSLGQGPRWLRLSDWELIRHCPVPLLLIKDGQPYASPPVLAAIDPLHTHRKPLELDATILQQAARLARALHGSLHVVHAVPPPPLVALPPDFPSVEAIEVLRAGALQRAREGVAGLLAREKVDAAVHMPLDQTPDVAIAQVVAECRSQLVVMGAVSRSRLQRWLIGDTARRVLDDLHCDVLVVKPSRPDA